MKKHELPKDTQRSAIEPTGHTNLVCKGFLTCGEVQKLLQISKSAWYKGCQDGQFPKPVKFGPRTPRWRVEDINALIEKAAAEAT